MTKKKAKKKPKISYTGLLKRALEFRFRNWIVIRDAKCVVCGTKKKLTNGHYFSRRNLSTKWDPINCNCQCIACNFNHENNPEPYRRYMVSRYGEKELFNLENRRRGLGNPSVEWLEDRVIEYVLLAAKVDYKKAWNNLFSIIKQNMPETTKEDVINYIDQNHSDLIKEYNASCKEKGIVILDDHDYKNDSNFDIFCIAQFCLNNK